KRPRGYRAGATGVLFVCNIHVSRPGVGADVSVQNLNEPYWPSVARKKPGSMTEFWDWSFAKDAAVQLSWVSLLTVKVTVFSYAIALTLGLVFAVFKTFKIKYLSTIVV